MEGDYVESHSQSNRAKFRDLGVAVLTIFSAPKAGKTSLLEKTLPVLTSDFNIAVIAADVYAPFDAERIRATGVPVWQISSEKGKTITPALLAAAMEQFPTAGRDLIVIESVIELKTAPAVDLGEDFRVLVCTLPEARELLQFKRDMWTGVAAVVLNKIDSVAHSPGALAEFTQQIAAESSLPVFPVSCATGKGVLDWTRWVRERVRTARAQCAGSRTLGSTL